MSRMVGAYQQKEVDYKELARQREIKKKGEREIESPRGPIRGSSEGL